MVTLCTLGVGTTFGASVMPGRSHSVSVITNDECTLLRVRRADFQEIFNEQSHLINDVESSPFCSFTSLNKMNSVYREYTDYVIRRSLSQSIFYVCINSVYFFIFASIYKKTFVTGPVRSNLSRSTSSTSDNMNQHQQQQMFSNSTKQQQIEASSSSGGVTQQLNVTSSSSSGANMLQPFEGSPNNEQNGSPFTPTDDTNVSATPTQIT